jgi:hypothetical protein
MCNNRLIRGRQAYVELKGGVKGGVKGTLAEANIPGGWLDGRLGTEPAGPKLGPNNWQGGSGGSGRNNSMYSYSYKFAAHSYK